jgi:hypothetical protein
MTWTKAILIALSTIGIIMSGTLFIIFCLLPLIEIAPLQMICVCVLALFVLYVAAIKKSND